MTNTAESKPTWSKRCAALGFILVTIFGNFVLTSWIFGRVAGDLLRYGFWSGVLLTLAGGLGMILGSFAAMVSSNDNHSSCGVGNWDESVTKVSAAEKNKSNKTPAIQNEDLFESPR